MQVNFLYGRCFLLYLPKGYAQPKVFCTFEGMEIHFRSKEESKRAQEEAFLALSPAERVSQFIKLSSQLAAFATKAPPRESGNFVIYKKRCSS